MDLRGKSGHLITITNRSTDETVHVFLYMRGDEDFDTYKAVVKGIRSIDLPEDLAKKARIDADPVIDFSIIEEYYPQVQGKPIYSFPAISFYYTSQKRFKEELFLCAVRNVIENGGELFPSNRLNAVATDSDFFDREDIVKDIWNEIEKEHNLLLCGPRRYGKTSILRHIEGKGHERGFTPIMVDLERIISPDEFVSQIWSEIEYFGLSESEKNRRAEEKEEDIQENWEKEGTTIFDRLRLSDNRYLLLLDECPYMIDSFLGKNKPDTTAEAISKHSREETSAFLKWFQEQRNRSRGKWVFIMTGSIDLKTCLEDNDLDPDSFTDLTERRITFFGEENVRTYVEGLLLGESIFLDDEIIDEITRIAAPGIPYFIQIIMNHLSSLYRNAPDFSAKDLRRVYEDKIVGHDGRRHFDTFERHFRRYGQREPGARAILEQLAHAGEEGVTKTDLTRTYQKKTVGIESSNIDIVLRYLENDFYIEKISGTDSFRFASPILRDYWKINQRCS